MREFSRTDRIAEQIKQELALIIQREIKDPRFTNMTSVTYVKVSKDLSYADVYLSFLNIHTAEEDKEINIDEHIKILQKAAGFIRHSLGQKIQLRQLPNLRFYEDKQIQTGARIDELLRSKDQF